MALDTVQANLKLGFPPICANTDSVRKFSSISGVRQLRLMTNNPRRSSALPVMDYRSWKPFRFASKPTVHNKAYLRTKRTKMGHLI